MSEWVTELSAWLGAHPEWIVLTIGITSFVESLAMVGVLVPGVAILYVASALAGDQADPALPCLLAAVAGAVAGDALSFFLGRYAHGPLLRRWPFDRHRQWLDRGERFIRRYGVPSVVIGRFVGPLRPVLPFVAGMLEMPPHRFIAVNLFSALLWAPVYILPGYLLGRLSLTELGHPGTPWRVNLALLAGVVAALALMALVHRWLEPGSRGYRALAGHLSWQWLQSPRSGERPLTSALLAGTALVGLLLLASTLVFSHSLAPVNQALNALFQQMRTPALDPWVTRLTLFGDLGNQIGLALIAAWALWRRGDRAGALAWLGGLALLVAGNFALKFGLAIPRPRMLEAYPHSYAFPSAHTSLNTLFFVTLAGFAAQRLSYRHRWWVYAPAALPVVAIGLSRLYLGVHWFTDVLGGILLALTVAGAMRVGYSRFDRPYQPRPGLWLPLLLGLIWYAGYLYFNLDGALREYAPR